LAQLAALPLQTYTCAAAHARTPGGEARRSHELGYAHGHAGRRLAAHWTPRPQPTGRRRYRPFRERAFRGRRCAAGPLWAAVVARRLKGMGRLLCPRNDRRRSDWRMGASEHRPCKPSQYNPEREVASGAERAAGYTTVLAWSVPQALALAGGWMGVLDLCCIGFIRQNRAVREELREPDGRVAAILWRAHADPFLSGRKAKLAQQWVVVLGIHAAYRMLLLLNAVVRSWSTDYFVYTVAGL
jgi:hypothetical protein